jgi:hypothetical protein
MLSKSELIKLITKNAKVIDAPPFLLPTFESSDQDGRPHIELKPETYHYFVYERGREYSRKVYLEIDELMYSVFKDVTFNMATSEEVKKRREGEDFRVQLYAIQEELIGKINKEFQERLAEEHQKQLQKNSVRISNAISL